jgi:hypothetical protein
MLCFAERARLSLSRILLQGIMVIRKIPVDELLDVQDKQSQRVSGEAALAAVGDLRAA